MSFVEWANRGKTVAGLIKELQAFENQDMEVRMSTDSGNTSIPISLVGKIEGKYAMLMNCEDPPSTLQHR